MKTRSTSIGTACLLILLSIPAGEAQANVNFETPDAVTIGTRPLYGLILGEYDARYANAPGFTVFVRNLSQLTVPGRLSIYPEFSWSFLYAAHASDPKARLLLFPFALNVFFDAPALHFQTPAGIFILKPYLGLGAYLIEYRSDRKNAIGVDFGYQAGVNLAYTHTAMKNFHVELSIDHLLTTNFKNTMPLLSFSIGFGYSFVLRNGDHRDNSIESSKHAPGESNDPAKRDAFLADLAGDDEKKIGLAADWLGAHREPAALSALFKLLAQDGRPGVRARAANAIGRIGKQVAHDYLIRAMKEENNDEVRCSIIRALASLQLNDATMAYLKDIRTRTADLCVMQEIDNIEEKRKEFK